jgi:hypothetical protein
LDVHVHPRVHGRHSDISDDDVLAAWERCLRFKKRSGGAFDEYAAVGLDSGGRLLEMVAARQSDDSWLVFHAMVPPTPRMLKELGLYEEKR